MVNLGSGSEREIDDILLTRYGCYLIAQNGDPRMESIYPFLDVYTILLKNLKRSVEWRQIEKTST